MKDPFHAGPITIAAIFILLIASISAPALLFTQTAIASTEGQDGTTNTTTSATTPTSPNNVPQRVAVGGGNITLSVNQFSPQRVEIRPGESVTFFAPQDSTEIHNVIFDMTNGTTITGIGVPFSLPLDVGIPLGGEVPTSAAEELLPAPPYNLGEPIIQNVTDDGTQAIIGFNKLAFYPAVVGQGDIVLYLEEEEISRQMLEMKQAFEQGAAATTISPISANYTIGGTERVVSSGIVLDVNGFSVLEELVRLRTNSSTSMTTTTTTTTPQSSNQQTITQQEEFGTEEEQILRAGESQEFPSPQFPFLNSFTVTFNEPETYDYFCAFHPGMFGQVVVGGGDSITTMDGQTNQR